MNKKSPFIVNKAVFFPLVILMVGILAISFINQDAFATVIGGILNAEVIDLKWTVGPIILFMLLVAVVLAVCPASKKKLGGPDAVAEYSNFSYWGMCVCSTIAIGIVFWGVAYPMTYYMEPWAGWGVEPGTPEAAVKAIAQTNLEWSGQYVLYGMFGLAMGISMYNYGQPTRTSSFLFLLRGKPAGNVVNIIIDILCVFGIIAGVTCSLGTGTMQLASGLDAIFGIEPSKMTWLLVEAIVVVGFILMSNAGIAKGIRIVTDQNLRIYYALMILMVIIGPTLYIFDMATESTGYLLNNFIGDITYTGGINGDDSPIFWMIWLYVSAVAFAPIVGLFMAKISYGRTIREMVVGAMLVPALVNAAWFIIFGATAIHWQNTGEMDIYAAMQEVGVEGAMWQFFSHLPAGKFFQIVFWIVIIISFVTLASSSTTTASFTSMVATREVSNEEEPPIWMKTVWGLIMAVSAFVFISYAGINGAKSMALIGGMPTLFLAALAAFCMLKYVTGGVKAKETFTTLPDKE